MRALPRPSSMMFSGLRSRCSTPLLVGGGQAGADLARDLDGLVLGQAADAAEQRGEVLAVHELHGEEVLPLRLADVVDAADGGMGDLAGRAHLVVEPIAPAGVVGQGLGQELEGHRLAEPQVVRAVDLAHAAAAEQGDDAVAVGEQRARARSAAAGVARPRRRCWPPATGRRPGDVPARDAGVRGAAIGDR